MAKLAETASSTYGGKVEENSASLNASVRARKKSIVRRRRELLRGHLSKWRRNTAARAAAPPSGKERQPAVALGLGDDSRVGSSSTNLQITVRESAT